MTSDHDLDADCWCEPVLHYTSPTTGAHVYIHRERGGSVEPPADFLQVMRRFANRLVGYAHQPEELHLCFNGFVRRPAGRFSLDEMGLEEP